MAGLLMWWICSVGVHVPLRTVVFEKLVSVVTFPQRKRRERERECMANGGLTYSVLIFIIVVLLLASDFYYCKNIAGRRLVGLRWWNETTDDGAGTWVFESADVRNPPSPLVLLLLRPPQLTPTRKLANPTQPTHASFGSPSTRHLCSGYSLRLRRFLSLSLFG